ncbi:MULTISPECIES: hypothetical protein [Sphingomonas]|uniref:hypothetical protein n=1 Tax=Sphingomonas TaxID=13687 RepID=UPI00254BB61C|nr:MULTISPECIES: hypothetical protein [Sphingomonas]MDK8187789.1 hypothetical protein [Sphingomonas zeae]MDK8217643.1 hypothetical protein [Sphingomonas sp. UMB7805-LC452B]
MWNRAGTVTVTNGSAVVTGNGTNFSFPNAQPGQAFIGPNGLPMEILSVDSATQLTLAVPYTGATANGQPFAILPTASFANDLALAFSGFKNLYGTMLDTIGQGMFPSGTAAAPGVRGSNDQDTGLRWLGENRLAFTSGGTDRAVVGADGLSVFGRMDLRSTIAVANPNGGPDQTYFAQDFYSPSGSLVGRIASVQATGTFVDAGQLALCTARGGVATEQVRIMDTGNIGIGLTSPSSRLDVALPGAGTPRVRVVSYGDEPAIDFSRYTGSANLYYGGRIGMNLDALCFYNAGGAAVGAGAWNERMRLDSAGNLLVGGTSGNGNAVNAHRISKVVSQAQALLAIDGNDGTSALFLAVEAAGNVSTSVPAAVLLGRNTGNGRSANAPGTINASGADYAEYMLKAAGCGIIAKGDVCGVDRDGKLTKAWADAISFVVKSTDPSLVGGDKWADQLPPRPQAPGAEPVAPIKPGSAPVAPVEPGPEPTEEGPVYVAWLQSRFAFAVAERDYAAALAEWQAATDAYPAARAAYEADHAAWVAATAAYERDLPAWEADLEAARQCVDRIAFCGQVPCNVTGDFEVGDYIVAVASGAGIKAVAVKPDAITLPQYMSRIGRVWAVRDGRAWIDVQHG